MACSLEKLTVTEDLGRRPRYARRARVHAVADELAAATDVVDGVLEHLAASAGLDDYGNLLARSISKGVTGYENAPMSNPYGLSFLSCSH